VLHDFPVKPVWAEVVIGLIVAVAILGFVAILNAYEIPTRRLERMFEARGEVMPEGFTTGYGIPYSVLILIVVAVIMTVVAQRTRLGRYIFATGGNPEAAQLSGIQTRALTVKVFIIGLALRALGGRRLGAADLPLQRHRHAGRTARDRRGGDRRHGAVGGDRHDLRRHSRALIMQSLQSGMAMVGVDAPYQNIVVGIVLVLAVYIDILYRKRTGS
jgi:D-xylose transport system permease protein